MTEEELKYIIARVIDNANDAIIESENNTSDPFFRGKRLAYYEVLDTIKNELIVGEQDLKEFGLDINLEEQIL